MMRGRLAWVAAVTIAGSGMILHAARDGLTTFAPTSEIQPPQPTEPAQAPQPPPIFRAGASLVRVDVTVTDRHGEPVTNLTADDFAVQEDDAPQTIETFKLVSTNGRAAEDDDTSLAIRSPEHAAAEAARDDVRVFLIFWDEYHIGRFASAIHGRRALSEFVAKAFGPTDLVALMDPLKPTDAIRFTRNHADLGATVQKLEGRFREYLPPRSVMEEAQLGRRDVERLRSEVTISAVKSAASFLGGLKEGRKSIIFVSEGLPSLDRSDEMSQMEDLIRTANTNNTAIYTLDPRGLVGGVADQLWLLAERTGATAFVNTNTPEKALRQVVKDASAFYLLGYASTRNPADGKFHQIKVRVKRSGMDVRARKGYWAPSASDMDRAAREAAKAAPDDVTEALAPVVSVRPERLFDVWVGASPAADRSTSVVLTWSARPQRAGAALHGTISVVADGPDGKQTIESPLDAQRLSFPSAAGSLNLRITIRDAAGQIIDEDKHQVQVPDFASAPISLSAPIVLRARNPLELRTLREAPDAVPYAGREFARTDRLFVRFAVHGTGASAAMVTARLLNKNGAALSTLNVTGGPSPGGYEIDLPLASVARGDYIIEIVAAAGDDRARELVPMRVAS
jgi:VWFA-related protein